MVVLGGGGGSSSSGGGGLWSQANSMAVEKISYDGMSYSGLHPDVRAPPSRVPPTAAAGQGGGGDDDDDGGGGGDGGEDGSVPDGRGRLRGRHEGARETTFNPTSPSLADNHKDIQTGLSKIDQNHNQLSPVEDQKVKTPQMARTATNFWLQATTREAQAAAMATGVPAAPATSAPAVTTPRQQATSDMAPVT